MNYKDLEDIMSAGDKAKSELGAMTLGSQMQARDNAELKAKLLQESIKHDHDMAIMKSDLKDYKERYNSTLQEKRRLDKKILGLSWENAKLKENQISILVANM